VARLPLTPRQRIIRAADRGTGLRLAADDVLRLACDSAIETRAGLDDACIAEHPEHADYTEPHECPWCNAHGYLTGAKIST